MSDTLYLQIDQNVEVHHPHVYLQDVAQLSCSNSKVLNRCRVLPVANLEPGKPGRYVFSVVDLIELIQKKEENLDISALGEASFLVTYREEAVKSKVWTWVKAVIICLATFFGTAFAIMSFNNDVDLTTLFGQIYQQVTGAKSSGFTILEITYSIGIGAGVLFFFNHFGSMKLTQDPTPMQVQMRVYEDDVNTTIIEKVERGKEQ